jgi:hypothetical protein
MFIVELDDVGLEGPVLTGDHGPSPVAVSDHPLAVDVPTSD